MNILFLSIGKLDNVEEKGLYTDLLREFRENGHKVYIVSARQKRLNKSTEFSIENGVNFLRVKIGNITKTNVIQKGISILGIERLYSKAIKGYLNDIKFDLVMYSTPPITFGNLISYIKQKDNAKTYLLLKDIFPQNAVDLNMFSKKSLFYRYFRNKEKKLYKTSDLIGCMSQANVDFILKNNPDIPSDIIEVCPNSIDPIRLKRNKIKKKEIEKKYNIPADKIVFIYGGNLGKPQGINFLIECLKSNKFNEMVYFIIVGSGTEFNRLNTFFIEEKLMNAQLIEQLPKNDYEDLVNYSDVGLIFLDHRFTIPNFPSRILSYMQSSLPVLAATDVNTDVGKVIEKGNFGYWCESNNVKKFNEKIQLLLNKKTREQMGLNARRYLEENYTSKHTYDIIMNHFK